MCTLFHPTVLSPLFPLVHKVQWKLANFERYVYGDSIISVTNIYTTVYKIINDLLSSLFSITNYTSGYIYLQLQIY